MPEEVKFENIYFTSLVFGRMQSHTFTTQTWVYIQTIFEFMNDSYMHA